MSNLKMSNFKVGDEVICLEGRRGGDLCDFIEADSDFSYGGFGYEPNKRFVIKEINERSPKRNILWPVNGDILGGVYEDAVVLVLADGIKMTLTFTNSILILF